MVIKYFQNNNFLKLLLFGGLISGVFLILFNTNKIIDYTKNEERKKIELWAMAQRDFIENNNPNDDLGNLSLYILTKSFENPVIQVDKKGKILSHKNIFEDDTEIIDSFKLKKILKIISKENDPIEIKFKNSIDQRLFYGNSSIYNKIKYYPFALLIIALCFSLIVYNYYLSSINLNKNKLWASFAKETAHQIATPLSSLMGWSTILKDENIDSSIINDIDKDIERLNKITERFSKVGSKPILNNEEINKVLKNIIVYLRERNSPMIILEFEASKDLIFTKLNKTLIEWVIENVVKNGIDSMSGKGKIKVSVIRKNKIVRILIKDNGAGILKKDYRKIFYEGYSLKQKGWGIGLSFSQRIVNDYHNGKIFVNKSEINKGSTIEINLPIITENS